MDFLILLVILVVGLLLAKVVGKVVYYGLAICLVIWAIGAFSGFN